MVAAVGVAAPELGDADAAVGPRRPMTLELGMGDHTMPVEEEVLRLLSESSHSGSGSCSSRGNTAGAPGSSVAAGAVAERTAPTLAVRN